MVASEVNLGDAEIDDNVVFQVAREVANFNLNSAKNNVLGNSFEQIMLR